jgi:hypothetical protein
MPTPFAHIPEFPSSGPFEVPTDKGKKNVN